MRSSSSPFCLTSPLPLQGHILAAQAIGDVYHWGKGVAVDYSRAMAAYKIAAEAGEALSQYQVGYMHCSGRGVAVDYKQARAWLEKAAAQDDPVAVAQLDCPLVVLPCVAPARDLGITPRPLSYITPSWPTAV